MKIRLSVKSPFVLCKITILLDTITTCFLGKSGYGEITLFAGKITILAGKITMFHHFCW